MASSGSSGSGVCQPAAALTIGTKVNLAVSWAGSTAGNPGNGTVNIWLLSKFTANGNSFTGTNQNCALSLPDIQLTIPGQIAAGGSKVQITIPSDKVWEKPTMPKFPSTGSITGWGPPNTITIDPVVALIGIAFPMGTDAATLAWPSSPWGAQGFPQGTTFPNQDGNMDGNMPTRSITGYPLNGNGYVYPPTAIGLGGSAPGADQVYIASRTTIKLSGQWMSCTDQSGTATVSQFDNHVVGCHIHGGAACTTDAANTQADFIDQNRTIYAPGAATFTSKTLADTAGCAEVISALP